MSKYKKIESIDGSIFQLRSDRLQEVYSEFDLVVPWRFVTLTNVRKALAFKVPDKIEIKAIDPSTGNVEEYSSFFAGYGRYDYTAQLPNFSIGCKVFVGNDLKILQAWANKKVENKKATLVGVKKARRRKIVAKAAVRR